MQIQIQTGRESALYGRYLCSALRLWSDCNDTDPEVLSGMPEESETATESWTVAKNIYGDRTPDNGIDDDDDGFVDVSWM